MKKQKNNQAKISTISAILIIIFIITTITAITVVQSQNYQTTSILNLKSILNNINEEITTYIQIKDQLGKYYNLNNQPQIQKISLLITPLLSKEIKITQLKAEIQSSKNIQILNYNQKPAKYNGGALFEHPVWKNISKNEYSLLVINDRDYSIINHGIMNDQTDIIYLTIKLPEKTYISYGEKINIKLFFPAGISKKITVEPPLPTQPVVNI